MQNEIVAMALGHDLDPRGQARARERSHRCRVLLDTLAETLIGEIDERHQRALSRDHEERAQRARRRELEALLATLTAREREVFSLVVRGKLNKEIAADLGIHERTVKLHRTAVTAKLDAHSVAELTQIAQRAGILP